MAGLGLIGAVLFLGQVLMGGPLSLLFHWQGFLILILGLAARALLLKDSAQVNVAIDVALKALGSKTKDSDKIESARKELVEVASVIRKDGLLAVEPARDRLKTPHLGKILKLVMDGLEFSVVQEILQDSKKKAHQDNEDAAQFFDAMADAAPLLGLLAACFQMTGALTATEGGGELVARALIAFVYGIVASEWVLRPVATRIRETWATDQLFWDLITSGVHGIQTGLSPQLLDSKLKQYGQSA